MLGLSQQHILKLDEQWSQEKYQKTKKSPQIDGTSHLQINMITPEKRLSMFYSHTLNIEENKCDDFFFNKEKQLTNLDFTQKVSLQHVFHKPQDIHINTDMVE